MVDFDMDCSLTESGWFELKTFGTGGGRIKYYSQIFWAILIYMIMIQSAGRLILPKLHALALPVDRHLTALRTIWPVAVTSTNSLSEQALAKSTLCHNFPSLFYFKALNP